MTGFSIILVEPQGERSIIVYRGANNFLSKDDIKENVIKNSRFLVFTSMLTKRAVLAIKKAVKIAEKNQVCIVANPSISMIKNNKKETIELLKKSHVIIVNEEEASFITNSSNIEDALKKLRLLGPPLAVVTLGAKGAVALADKIYRQKAFKVKTIDTTGAGDTFSAGFLHYIAKGRSVKEALEFACATAAINITTYGATKEFPSERKILKFIRGG
jgi:ribokinase